VALALTAGAVTASLGASQTADAKRNCSGSAWLTFKRALVKRKPTSLHSSWVRGPGKVSLRRGRDWTSGSSITITGGGAAFGLDFGLVKAEWNEGHDSRQITRTKTGSVSETITYRVPRGRIARVMTWRAKLVTRVTKWKSNHRCRSVRVGRARVTAPIKHRQLLFTRQFLN
jgi:hypothetical protein